MDLVRIRKFLASDYFNIIMFAIAAIIVMIDQVVATPYYYGFTIIYGFLICAILVLTDDIVSILCPALLLVSFCVQYHDSYDGFIKYLWGAPIIAFAFIFHIVAYRKKFEWKNPRELELFVPMCFVSVAMMLGGVGIMSLAEYTTKINIVYMILLGPGMTFMYVILSGIIGPGKNNTDDMPERLSKILVTVSCFIIFEVIEFYCEGLPDTILHPEILFLQWRNNISTMLMLYMPFSFYLAEKKNFLYIIVPFASIGAIVLSGSRGGLLFGIAEFVFLILYYAVVDKKHRIILLIFTSLFVIVGIAFVLRYTFVFKYTISRFLDPGQYRIRLKLWFRSIEDFKANIITGRGIGYMGNRDAHPSKIGQLCWYHSSIPQVIGSFGIVGIFCYLYQFICRLEFFNKRWGKELAVPVFWSFIGLEMMSFVNPGIFAPAFLFILVLFIVFVEQYNE